MHSIAEPKQKPSGAMRPQKWS